MFPRKCGRQPLALNWPVTRWGFPPESVLRPIRRDDQQLAALANHELFTSFSSAS